MELQQAKGDLGEERKKNRDLRNDLEVSWPILHMLPSIIAFFLRAPSKRTMKWLISCCLLEKTRRDLNERSSQLIRYCPFTHTHTHTHSSSDLPTHTYTPKLFYSLQLAEKRKTLLDEMAIKDQETASVAKRREDDIEEKYRVSRNTFTHTHSLTHTHTHTHTHAYTYTHTHAHTHTHYTHTLNTHMQLPFTATGKGSELEEELSEVKVSLTYTVPTACMP